MRNLKEKSVIRASEFVNCLVSNHFVSKHAFSIVQVRSNYVKKYLNVYIQVGQYHYPFYKVLIFAGNGCPRGPWCRITNRRSSFASGMNYLCTFLTCRYTCMHTYVYLYVSSLNYVNIWEIRCIESGLHETSVYISLS